MATYWQSFRHLLSLFCFLFCCVSKGQTIRIKEKIYIDLVTQNGCFRLLNGTHQIGCSSSQGGDTGVVYYVKTEEDFKIVTETGSTTPYVAVLDSISFTTNNVRRLVKSGRVAGIAVISVNLTKDYVLDSYSPDVSCPNDAYGLYHGKDLGNCKAVKWNTGDGLFFDDFGISVFSLTSQEDVDKVINKCWEPFNKPAADGGTRSYPLCAMQLQAAMAAAKDSETCIRRSNMIMNLTPMQYCDPMGDWNIVTTVKDTPNNVTRPNASVIVVATRVDSFGLFANEYPSSDSTVTGIVALLATAKALWKLQRDILETENSKDILFTFFQGEAFDYIGSSRMVYDMRKGNFPSSLKDTDKTFLQKINLDSLDQFVELSQVGMRSDKNSLWMHVDPNFYNRNKTKMDNMMSVLQRFGASADLNTTFSVSSTSNPLPPSSVQQFLMEAGSKELPSFVITDHQNSFTNKFYNSRLDLPWQIEADYPSGMNDSEKMYNANTTQSRRITGLATALARYLFWAATGSDPTEEQKSRLTAEIAEVNHMLYCFLYSPHCELFNATISPDDASALSQNKQPYPFYVSVSTTKNQVTSLVQRILAYYTGTVVQNATKSSCDVSSDDKEQRYSLLWMQGPQEKEGGRNGVCYKSTVTLTKAESPAFQSDYDDYDWSSYKYSTWTESRWEIFKVRVFLLPSQRFQTQVLAGGVIILILSLIIVYFFSARAEVLFAKNSSSREYLYEIGT